MFKGIFSRMKTHRGSGTVVTPPEINFTAQGGDGQIVLTWDDVFETETGFAIYRSTISGGVYSLIHTTAANAVTHTDTSLSEATTYYYKLVAEGAFTHEYEASGTTIIPAPSNLSADTVSSTQINLTWDDNSTTETGFEIYRSTTSGSGFSLIHTTAANVESYNNTGLTENTTYYYRIRAIGAAINSDFSAEDGATTSPALNAPSDLQATAASSSQIDLSWTDNSTNETGFEIHRATSSGGTFSLIHTTAANVTTYQNTGLSTATAYYYKVRAVNAEGSTAFTSEATATTQSGTVPAAPSALATSTVTTSSILITWTDNSSNETGFQIERSPDSNTSFALIHTTAAGVTSYNDTGLDEGRRYYYRVRATNGAGNSAYTSQVHEITTWSTPVTYIGKGTAATTTTSTISVPLPSSPTVGRMMVMILGAKAGGVWAATPSGWQTGNNEGFVDYHGGTGTDRGAVVGTVFWKICGASETGPVNVSFYNSPNNVHGVIYLFEKDANAYWSIDITGGAHREPGTSYSATSYEKMNLIKGDAVFIASIINSDNMAWQDQALTHSGTTLTETSEEVADLASTVGRQQRMVASLYHVSNNVSNTQKCVYTMTASSATADAPMGITIFVRLRNARTQPTYTSQPRVWRAADLVNTTQGTYDTLNIWDGRRISVEGPDAVSTKLSIATFNGRPCMKYFADFTTGINRRSETSYAWQPILPLGTQIIEEWKMETDSTATQAVGEWIFMQHHTGTAPGGPYPQNNPVIYLAWSSVGQTGWDNLPGSSPGGELVIVNNARDGSNNYLRYRSNVVTWGPNKVYRFRMHMRFDIASGDPVLKVWAAEDDDPFTLVFENYTYQTVAMTNAEIGSYPLCGGTTKLAIYHHLIRDEATRAASVAYGHTDVTLYIPCHKAITQLPGDSFYVTDVTNNELDIYDLVSTLDE